MKTTTFTKARKNLRAIMESLGKDHIPVIVRRRGKKAVVVLLLVDYATTDETAFLMRSPANARRLEESIAQLHK